MMSTSSSLAVESTAPTTAAPAASLTKPQRLMSLDALRGFDMFWIVGGEGIFIALERATAGTIFHAPFAFMAWQLDHSAWAGFRFYDLIFPMFVFMVGASLVFSLGKIIAQQGRREAVRRVLVRSALLFAFGLAFYRASDKDHALRIMGVLQRIALAYLFAGLLFCYLRPSFLVVAAIALLAGYWAMMTYIPAPGQTHVSFDEGKNLANWIDAHYLPGFKWDGDHDPEGILSTIPAIASCLLGVFAGLLLKEGRQTPKQKALWLIGAGVISVALGFLWGIQFPVIKKLWTSSFVLVAGGYSALLLGAFYMVIDVWRVRAWSYPFVWIGMNAITLYLVEHFLSFQDLADWTVGHFSHHLSATFTPVAAAILAVLFMLALAGLMYKCKVFLRV